MMHDGAIENGISIFSLRLEYLSCVIQVKLLAISLLTHMNYLKPRALLTHDFSLGRAWFAMFYRLSQDRFSNLHNEGAGVIFFF